MILKHNRRERAVQEDGLAQGWKILCKGWPDFLFYKEELGKIGAFLVEVKSKENKRFSSEQKEMHRVLKKMGFEVKIIYKD